MIGDNGGMNVWVRSSASKPAVSPTGGPGGGGMLTFDRTLSQFLDGGARKLNVASNGGFTFVSVMKFTGSAGAHERLIDFGNAASSDSIAIYRDVETTSMNAGIWNGATACVISVAGAINQNNWQKIVMTYNAANFALTLTVDLLTQSKTCPTMTIRTLTRTFVGKSNWAADGTLNANIAGLYAVDALLTTAQINSLIASMHAGLDAQEVCRACPAG